MDDNEIKPNYVVEFNMPSDGLGWWVSSLDNGERAHFHNFQSALAFRNQRVEESKRDEIMPDEIRYRVRNTYTGMTWTAEGK